LRTFDGQGIEIAQALVALQHSQLSQRVMTSKERPVCNNTTSMLDRTDLGLGMIIERSNRDAAKTPDVQQVILNTDFAAEIRAHTFIFIASD
jgi:hypothetical protein